MDCIVWLANEINRLLQYLDEEDRWYESFEPDDKEDFVNGGGKVLWNRERYRHFVHLIFWKSYNQFRWRCSMNRRL